MKQINFKLSDQPQILCRDHVVTGEEFQLYREDHFDMLVTEPKPLPEELDRYYQSENYISHTDSKRGFLDVIYQGVKKYMIRRKMDQIESRFGRKGTILDVGAGTGSFLLEAKKRGWEVSGAEPNSKARAVALKKNVYLDERTTRFPEGHFDVITMWHVLEHVYSLEEQILELERLLKDGGLLLVAVPNFRSYDAQVYGSSWAAYDVPRHLYHFSRTSIRKIFSLFGFQVKEEIALPFDAYYVSLLSEKYKSGPNRFRNGFFSGWVSNRKAKRTGEYSSIIYFIEKTGHQRE